MPIKTYRPITPSLRFTSTVVNDDLTTDRPYKPLTSIRKRTGGRRNTGDLTIRGTTKSVVLDVDGPTAPVKDPWGNQRSAITATTKINRQDFGVKWNATMDNGGVVVGDEVSITIDAEMVQAKK